MTWHTQCNDRLKPRWIGLSHAQLSGHWDEMKAQNTKHACTMLWPIQEAQEHNSQKSSKSDKCASVKTLSALNLVRNDANHSNKASRACKGPKA